MKVPDAYYKVLYLLNEDMMVCYYIEHKEEIQKDNLNKFIVSPAFIEEKANIKLKMPASHDSVFRTPLEKKTQQEKEKEVSDNTQQKKQEVKSAPVGVFESLDGRKKKKDWEKILKGK